MNKPSEIQTAFNALIDSINDLGKDAGGLRPSDLVAVNDMTTAIKNLKADNAALVEALERIANWNDLDVKTRCDIGSNGERNHYIAVAKEALDEAKGDV